MARALERTREVRLGYFSIERGFFNGEKGLTALDVFFFHEKMGDPILIKSSVFYSCFEFNLCRSQRFGLLKQFAFLLYTFVFGLSDTLGQFQVNKDVLAQFGKIDRNFQLVDCSLEVLQIRPECQI